MKPAISTQNQSRTFYDEKATDYFRHQFVKSFLHNLHTGRISEPDITTLRLVAQDGNYAYRLKPVTVGGQVGNDTSFVLDDNIEATIIFKDATYDVTVVRYKEPYTKELMFVIGALGLSDSATNPHDLIRFLLDISCFHSPLRNQYLFVKPSDEDTGTKVQMIPKNIESVHLSEIFLPDDTMSALKTFVECIRSFDKIRQPLRYLLSGKPGTAKTKIIRAIATEACDYATFVFSSGAESRIDEIFDFAECFRPVVVCIDDADLMVGSRKDFSERKALGKFLQRLDGFVTSSVFVLATTNDKQLVDVAASRPGRFDRILDLISIDSQHYRKMIESESNYSDIAELFDDEVIFALREKSVSGAFLANLIKQLHIKKELENEPLTREMVMNLLVKLSRGFNGKSSSNKPIGFGATRQN